MKIYSFIEPQACNMGKIVRDFEAHIFLCWRKGYKTKKILETWDGKVAEDDVQSAFKTVTERYHAN